jgi:hypothetical protein
MKFLDFLSNSPALIVALDKSARLGIGEKITVKNKKNPY